MAWLSHSEWDLVSTYGSPHFPNQETHEHQTDGQAVCHDQAHIVLHLKTTRGGR